jgi:DMSO/TMAO reductase YedYZ molybdopterin-dependent catalytic subunit
VEASLRTRTGLAGLIAVAVALAAGELLAGLVVAIASPLASVGGFIVDSAPPFVKDFAIAVFGTADKAALAFGTTVIALALGWQLGVRSVSRRWVAPVVFGLFGLLGIVAAWNEPFAQPAPVVAATLATSGLGWLTLLLLQSAAAIEEPTDALAGDASRRRFLRLAAGTSAAAVVAGAVGRTLLTRLPDVPDIDVTVGGTGAAEVPNALAAFELDVAGITPIVVPNDEFYRIDTALIVPTVDETDWSLRIHGLVDQEVVLGYQDLLAMERVEQYVTIACVSNEVGGDLVGNALWSGVRLTDVLDLAGVAAGASQLVARSVDGFTTGFPPQLAYDGRNPLIAIGMNGEPLPRPHGFPARLIVPGLYGYVSATKWLSDIELTTWDGFDAYWIPRGWAKEAPIKTQSRIDAPDPRVTHPAGPTAIGGVAWAPVTGIRGVEVRVADGEWLPAEVSTPLSDAAWVQWRLVADLAPGTHRVEVRATDGNGVTQTDIQARPRPDGATGHHTITLRVA